MATTARFSEIVKKCGRPEEHLIFGDPKEDRALQAAVKARRVMTLFQNNAGGKTDRARVGLEVGPGRQFLVFPKSLQSYEGLAVVGIKYEMVESPQPAAGERVSLPRPAPQAKKAPQAPAREPEETKENKKKEAVSDVRPALALFVPDAEEPEEAKEKALSKGKEKPKTKDKPPANAAPKPKKVAPPRPKSSIEKKAKGEKVAEARPTPGRSVAALVKGIQRAVKLLEKGQSVPAYKVLKELVE